MLLTDGLRAPTLTYPSLILFTSSATALFSSLVSSFPPSYPPSFSLLLLNRPLSSLSLLFSSFLLFLTLTLPFFSLLPQLNLTVAYDFAESQEALQLL